jgi:pSer/pThr/pTyr-binding forkhead associated (FHA) protein
MMPAPSEISKPAARRPARDIIDAIVENMRASREPLKYSTLAPSRFTVFLHPSEFARLQDIVPILQEEAARALSEELERLNRQSRVSRWFTKFSGQPEPAVRNPAGEWQVEFVADADGELQEGDLLVDSQLVLPGRPELGVGERTRRITTVRRGTTQSITKQQTSPTPQASVPRVLAHLAYEDQTGRHVYEISDDLVSIGRGGTAFPVDLRIESSPDVSREHARIRRDAQSGRFFLIDLSSLGTTLNGRHVPRGYDDVEGVKRENGAETALPDGARIGLADTVFLDFRLVRS